MAVDDEHERFVRQLWREFYTPYKPKEQTKPRGLRRQVHIPVHPLALVDAEFNLVVQDPVFTAYHADRAARGATDSLAINVANWLEGRKPLGNQA